MDVDRMLPTHKLPFFPESFFCLSIYPVLLSQSQTMSDKNFREGMAVVFTYPEVLCQLHVLGNRACSASLSDGNKILPPHSFSVCYFRTCCKIQGRGRCIFKGLPVNRKKPFDHMAYQTAKILLPGVHLFGGNVTGKEGIDVNILASWIWI